MVVLLGASAFISGSEVACFSLSPSNIRTIKEGDSRREKYLKQLLDTPQQLLATILIINNFVNVGIIILSSFITGALFDFASYEKLGFLFQVIFVTFLLLLFGEIIPKVYANQYAMRFAFLMTLPLYVLEKLFRPLSSVLISSTSVVLKRLQKKQMNISMDDLSEALDLTENSIHEDKDILKGIVNFTDLNVKEIIKSRMDIVAIDVEDSPKLSDIVKVIIDSGFSRIPIYEGSLDNIKGVFYSKDLLAHLDKDDTFDWRVLIKAPYYVPETKKINDLLEEFQTKKIHLAIVIDEYGGTSGIVTLEDILEEIVGEISDEYDEEQDAFTKIDDNTYLFEGKIMLNDFYKIVGVSNDIFDKVKGDADTLAGLYLELKGYIPQKDDETVYEQFTFIIEAVDKRRILKIKVLIK